MRRSSGPPLRLHPDSPLIFPCKTNPMENVGPMTGSFESYFVVRSNPPGQRIEREGIFNAQYVAKFVAEARAEGYPVELIDGFVRVTFEPGIWREFYTLEGEL